MKSTFLKDMAFRKARIAMTAIAITVLIALILMLGGIMNGMRIQAQQYVKSTGADIWISAEGSGGAFVGFSMINPEYLAYLNNAQDLKPKSTSQLVFAQARPVIRGKTGKAIVVGYQNGKLGGPVRLVEGRLFTPSQYEDYRPEDIPSPEVVIDEKMDLEIGERLSIGGSKLKVVGKAKSLMFVLDTPLLFMDIRTAQNVMLDNILYVNMILSKAADGRPSDEVVEALNRSDAESKMIEVYTLKQTIGDILETYVDEPMKAVQFLRAMLWLATGIIVAMITYVTTLEKTQEFGTLKAIGASNSYVISLILKQVALTTIIGIIFGLVLSFIFAAAAPIFVAIHLVEAVIVAIISFIVCCSGGYLAGRKAISIDPMVAFRGEI
ncbi:MAG: ABC transporter permease [Candidatus Poribacteria bacterium]|nr:ABC transporter permease [Candidatus Poribacteria bacterium]